MLVVNVGCIRRRLISRGGYDEGRCSYVIGCQSELSVKGYLRERQGSIVSGLAGGFLTH